MYKTASQYLGPDKDGMLFRAYKDVDPIKENFKYTTNLWEKPSNLPQPAPPKKVRFSPQIEEYKKESLDLVWNKKEYTSFSNPQVWGPAFWFSLHTSAINYPENPSTIFKERMKGRILAIPFEIPCPACRPHASAFVEQHKNNLDSIVNSRKNLFNFYVDFHNKVNERYGKKIYTYKEAWDLYTNPVTVNTLSYD